MLKDSRCPWMAGNVERPLNTLTACPSLRNFSDQKHTLVRLHMAQKPKTSHRLLSRATVMCPELAVGAETANP